MTGPVHHYVAGLRADHEVQYTERRNGTARYHRLHCAQGALDSACAIVSALQAVMLLTGIPRKQIESVSRTRSGPLYEFWRRARSLYFQGVTGDELLRLVEPFKDLEAEVVQCRTAARYGEAALNAITAGHVPILQFDSSKWSHWSTVVGVECLGEGLPPWALLTLDPDRAAPWGIAFNGRLQLRAKAGASVRGSKAYPTPLRYITGEAWGVRLEAMCVVKRRQPP